jgi:predicted DNA-binding transcriptional regulator AlpA
MKSETSTPRTKLRSKDAAAHLGVTRSTLAKWRMNGKGPQYHRCGPRIVYYYEDELNAWQTECDRREAERVRGLQDIKSAEA